VGFRPPSLHVKVAVQPRSFFSNF